MKQFQLKVDENVLAAKLYKLEVNDGVNEPPTPRLTPSLVTASCPVFDCNRRAFLRGYCAKHWRLAKRNPENDTQVAENDFPESEENKNELASLASTEYLIPTLVSDPSGESHWEEKKENLINSGGGPIIYGSQEFRVTNLIIQEFSPKTKINFECSPVPQLITILVGTFTIHASDGKFKTVTPGSLILLQDHVGKGHQIGAIGSGKHLLTRASLESTSSS